MKIAVIGGGIFGCTAAIYAARGGQEVTLFEKNQGLLYAASGINQYRLHRGYHYPRSPETAYECQAGLQSFMKEYGDAVIETSRHLYAIAKKEDGSRVDAAEFVGFCARVGIAHKIVHVPEIVNHDNVDQVIEGVEARFDPYLLKLAVEEKLDEAGVDVRLGWPMPENVLSRYDRVVIAAYANTNEIADALGCASETFQFEVCEKPAVRLPGVFGDTCLVVMDGPFCSIDPMGCTGHYVLGHVEHAIHHRNIGLAPEVPEHLKAYLNQGIVAQPEHTHFDKFIEAGSKFVPCLERAEHIGSMYTVRAVMPFVDATDERPTLVSPLSDRVIRLFSGKIPTCVQAARSTLSWLQSSHDKTDGRP